MSGRRHDVSIQFFPPDRPPYWVQAQVVRRQREMVIAIPGQPLSGPYLVHGLKTNHFFAGVDSLEHEQHVHVVARWALLAHVCALRA
jgi:hypothetical protein